MLLWPVVRCIGLRSRSAGSVLLIGLVGGFAPAAAATAEAVRSRELTSQEASALLPACICSGPSFVILTVGEQLLGSRTAGVCLFAAQVLAGWLTAALLCRVRGIPEPLPAPPAAAQTEPPPALDTICASSGDLPEIVRLCAVFSPVGGRLRAAAAGACTLSGHAAMLGCDYAARTGLWASGLCCAALSVQGTSGAGANAPSARRRSRSTPYYGARVLHLPLSLALFYLGLPQSAVEKLQYFVRPCSAHASRADRLRPAGVRGVLHHGLRGLPPDQKRHKNAAPANKNRLQLANRRKNVVT